MKGFMEEIEKNISEMKGLILFVLLSPSGIPIFVKQPEVRFISELKIITSALELYQTGYRVNLELEHGNFEIFVLMTDEESIIITNCGNVILGAVFDDSADFAILSIKRLVKQLEIFFMGENKVEKTKSSNRDK